MQLPHEITAGGRTRTVSQHIRNEPHIGVTARRVEYVLENWVIRGIHTSPDGRQSRIYLAVVPGLGKMVRVAVSIDDETVVTAFPDGSATNNWNKRNLDYFTRRYQNLEMRDESQI